MEAKLRNSVIQLANLLTEWKGENTVALRLDSSVSWASYCLICSCNSLTHMRGILNQLRHVVHGRDSRYTRYALDNGTLEASQWLLHNLPRHWEDAAWCPVDMGAIVIHLMSPEARAFYELEELWPIAEVLETD